VCCFVSMQPHAGLDKVVTPTVMFTSQQMVWEIQAVTHIPLSHLSKQVSGQTLAIMLLVHDLLF